MLLLLFMTLSLFYYCTDTVFKNYCKPPQLLNTALNTRKKSTVPNNSSNLVNPYCKCTLQYVMLFPGGGLQQKPVAYCNTRTSIVRLWVV